jgi:hypothetical protein
MIALAALAALAGCAWPVARPKKPELYQVRGRVIDGGTGQGLAYARLLLRVSLQTSLGPRTLAAYGVSAADGSYSVEVSETFDVVRCASQVRLDATKRGYVPAAVDVPVPEAKQPFYGVPDIVLGRTGGPVSDVPAAPPGLAPGILRQAKPVPRVPWKDEAGGP